MKKWLMFFFLFNTLFSVAQNAIETVIPDDRLYEVYERDYVDGLVIENPFLIKRWNFYLDNAFLIADEVKGKEADYPTVTISDFDNINILLLEKEQKLQRDWDIPVIYKIRGTDKILVYHAGKDFTKSLKEYLGENKI
jgi:hypothetical protein